MAHGIFNSRHNAINKKFLNINEDEYIGSKVNFIFKVCVDVDFFKISYILQKDSIPLHFTYEQALSKKYGLPLTRYDWPTIGLNGKKCTCPNAYFFERAYLTSEEIKVIKAWAEYAKNNPVE
jgi:hypothetical protein